MLTGSTEMQSATLQDLEREDRDRRMADHGEDQALAQIQFLYDRKQGRCDLCGHRIAQPADADALTDVLLADGSRGDKLIHRGCFALSLREMATLGRRLR